MKNPENQVDNETINGDYYHDVLSPASELDFDFAEDQCDPKLNTARSQRVNLTPQSTAELENEGNLIEEEIIDYDGCDVGCGCCQEEEEDEDCNDDEVKEDEDEDVDPELVNLLEKEKNNLPTEDDLRENLADIFRECNVRHTVVNRILLALNPFHPTLPRQARTMLRTPRKTDSVLLNNGKYSHFGLEKGIIYRMKSSTSPNTNELTVDVNMDGLSVHNSTGMECWPILARCRQLSDPRPFVVGLFTGEGKPDPIQVYLKDYVAEVKRLEATEVRYENTCFKIKVKLYICDCPGRTYVKQVKGHAASNGCERCHQTGKKINDHLIYSKTKDILRTDQTFRLQLDPDYHHGESPLSELAVDFIKDFVLDELHLLDGGAMKKFLEYLKVSQNKGEIKND